MKPALTMVTLGVADIDRSLKFYKDGLGWKTDAKPGDPVAFFPLSNGVLLGLFGRAALAEDAGVPDDGAGFRGVTLAHNAASRAEADAALEDARRAGATIVKPAQDVFWGGYSGYFADPDGHLWEVAHNPFWTLDENGAVRLRT